MGLLEIGYEGEKVIALGKINQTESEGIKNALTDQVYEQVMEYMEGKRKEFAFPYEMKGTQFQKKVWQELCRIPYGETRTYKEIAIAIGNPKACRAVGMANHNNPIAIAVPCHRVIGSNGKMVGYAGGLEMKESLLALERKYKS